VPRGLFRHAEKFRYLFCAVEGIPCVRHSIPILLPPFPLFNHSCLRPIQVEMLGLRAGTVILRLLALLAFHPHFALFGTFAEMVGVVRYACGAARGTFETISLAVTARAVARRCVLDDIVVMHGCALLVICTSMPQQTGEKQTRS
jgi:hypothetical protein